jgi:hypothetical protein
MNIAATAVSNGSNTNIAARQNSNTPPRALSALREPTPLEEEQDTGKDI